MKRTLVVAGLMATLFLGTMPAARAETVCGLAQANGNNGDYVEMKWPGTDWQASGITYSTLIRIGAWWYTYNFRRDHLPNNVIVLVRLRNGSRAGKIYAISTADVSQGGDARYGIARLPNLTW